MCLSRVRNSIPYLQRFVNHLCDSHVCNQSQPSSRFDAVSAKRPAHYSLSRHGISVARPSSVNLKRDSFVLAVGEAAGQHAPIIRAHSMLHSRRPQTAMNTHFLSLPPVIPPALEITSSGCMHVRYRLFTSLTFLAPSQDFTCLTSEASRARM